MSLRRGFSVSFFPSSLTYVCQTHWGNTQERFFLVVFFHSRNKMIIFASERAEVGEVSLPVWSQIQISNLILTFQTLNETVTLIRLQSFRFSYSF